MNELSFLSNALEFSQLHLSKYTGCLHYKSEKEPTRDVIPMVENILYGAFLVTTFSKEKAEKGLNFLERLFNFCTDQGFASYLHDFPNVYNDRANVDIFLALCFFLKNYGKFIPSAHKAKIENILEKLENILANRSLNEIDSFIFETAMFKTPSRSIEAKSLPEYEKIILCKLLLGEKVELDWHPRLNVYTGPLLETYYKGMLPTDSFLSILATGKGIHESSLFGTLLPKTGIFDLISYKEFDRDDLLVNHNNNILSIHFSEHTLLAKGDMELNIIDDHIEIILDEFEEVEFFFSDYKKSKILVENQTATAFYPEDTIFLITADKKISLKFISKKTRFMGHIMKANRYNQLLNCEKNLTLYDHMILLREVV